MNRPSYEDMDGHWDAVWDQDPLYKKEAVRSKEGLLESQVWGSILCAMKLRLVPGRTWRHNKSVQKWRSYVGLCGRNQWYFVKIVSCWLVKTVQATKTGNCNHLLTLMLLQNMNDFSVGHKVQCLFYAFYFWILTFMYKCTVKGQHNINVHNERSCLPKERTDSKQPEINLQCFCPLLFA